MRGIMALTFNELCKQLNLQSHYSSPKQLEALEQWCANNISQDRKFYGDPEERYERYLRLTKKYLDDFLSFTETNPITASFEDEMTVIQYAASKGFNYFLQKSCSTIQQEILNAQTPYRMTALHLAALGGYYQTVKTLLDFGARPTIANANGKFPLQCALFKSISFEENEAAWQAKIKTFKLLQEKAPFLINAVDKSGETAVHSMAAQGFSELIHELVHNKNAIVVQPNNFKKYPIHVAILNGQLQCARELLAYPETVKLIDAEGRTPLHYAAKYANNDFVEACCNSQAEIDARNKVSMTPLLTAAAAGNLPGVQLLIQKGADSSLIDYRGFTLLHFAALSKNAELVFWILDNLTINVNAEDNRGHTALYCLQTDPEFDQQSEEIVAILLKKGASPNPPPSRGTLVQ
jgi:uncharacterized protein